MVIQSPQFRNLTDMALVLHTHIAMEVKAVADLLAAARSLVESHLVYSSLLEGARMGVLQLPSCADSLLIVC